MMSQLKHKRNTNLPRIVQSVDRCTSLRRLSIVGYTSVAAFSETSFDSQKGVTLS